MGLSLFFFFFRSHFLSLFIGSWEFSTGLLFSREANLLFFCSPFSSFHSRTIEAVASSRDKQMSLNKQFFAIKEEKRGEFAERLGILPGSLIVGYYSTSTYCRVDGV